MMKVREGTADLALTRRANGTLSANSTQVNVLQVSFFDYLEDN